MALSGRWPTSKIWVSHIEITATKKRVILSVVKNPDEIRLDYTAITFWILHSSPLP